MKTLVRRVLPFSMAGALFASCGGQPPALPPKDSMAVDFGSLQSGNGLNSKANWGQAALRVAVLDLWVVAGLAPEVVVFEGARSQTPKADGDQWIWTYPVKTATVDATATLSAHMDGKASVWEMRVSGKVGQETLKDFLWYDGRYEVSTGSWQIYDKNGKLVRIEWTVNSPTDKQLKFTNDTGGADDGAFLSYALKGDGASVSYDLKQSRKADIAWSVSTKAGSINAADWAEHANETRCWDGTLADAACPVPTK